MVHRKDMYPMVVCIPAFVYEGCKDQHGQISVGGTLNAAFRLMKNDIVLSTLDIKQRERELWNIWLPS